MAIGLYIIGDEILSGRRQDGHFAKVRELLAERGLQRNAIMASFGALKDLDMIIVVDEDIDIRDPADVEYALATRMEASKDLILIPGARGHEYVRAGNNGIRTKLGIDATVPFEEKARFKRVEFSRVDRPARFFTSDNDAAAAVLRAGEAVAESI